jgi:pilus assembly protein CpaE
MSQVQRIAIVDPSDSTREQLRNVLLGMESVWLDNETPRYEFFYDIVMQSRPDVAMISLDADQAKALALIEILTAEAPETPILAISSRNDGQAILKALRCGAKEFLTAPVVLEDIIKALSRLGRGPGTGRDSRSGDANGARSESQVISVLGSRGGVGCTSLAVNLAATLAIEPSFSTALVDLDLALGDADVALDLAGDYTLADVALNVDRLDMQFLKRSLCKHSSGLSVLPHPVQLEDAALIREDHLQRVIGLLRASYTHLVLDLSKSFSPTDVTALRMSDAILLVCQLDLSSLRNTVRMLMALGNDEALTDKVRIVVNRVGMPGSGITVAKAEETLGKPIAWQVPNEPKLLDEARDEGKPLMQHAPRCKMQQAIVAMASALAGKPIQAAAKEAPKAWSFFS